MATPQAESRVVHHAEMPEEHPERHEHSDVSVRGIWITVGAVLVVTALVHVLLYFVFFAYEGAQKAEDEADRRSAITDVISGPPEEVPRLQGISGFNADTPAVDLIKMREQNKQFVDGYGKTADGRVHIPIDRAIELSLEHNLFPARGASTTAPATKPAGGSNAGR